MCQTPPTAQWQRTCLPCRKAGRCGFDPWVRKISWRRKWQPTPVFLPGKSNGQRGLGAIVHRVAKSWTQLSTHPHTHTHTHTRPLCELGSCLLHTHTCKEGMSASMCSHGLSRPLAHHDFGLESRHFPPSLFYITVKIKAPPPLDVPQVGLINSKVAKSEESS